ncbi:MAG: hypothetical protein GWN58_35315 [Anaerolineae bacterium]|nr:hypothetical protein [Anaerolineae bacterium]
MAAFELPKVCQFVKLSEMAERVLNCDAEWEVKYDVIFGQIAPQVGDTGIVFDWLDMDTTYEEDATNYVEAFLETAKEYQKVLVALGYRQRG